VDLLSCKWQVMKQCLRRTQSHPSVPESWEVPIQPLGGGNVFAMVYSFGGKEECEKIANHIVRIHNSSACHFPWTRRRNLPTASG